ncbi:hypothetical protein [Streptomyces sp. wa1063]|uniref:hypothetical protein n=1 Tax=Streptomyces sp. wa1063 TaxID=1828212 RepID=UPI00211D6B8B|nr:hypothetical protein [Streptomyces sp. wa1063]
MSTPTLFEPTPAAGLTTRPAAVTQPLVIGLDMALGTSGIAGPGWTDTVRTGDRSGEARLDYIVDRAASFYRHADFAVIEGAAFSLSSTRGSDELSAIRWMVRCDLRRRGIPFAVVNPDSRTIYATGKARWKDEQGRKLTKSQVKGLVRNGVAEQYGIECTGTTRYDEADAYVLMAMGSDWLGYPLAELPATHRRALKAVPWPTTPVAVAR